MRHWVFLCSVFTLAACDFNTRDNSVEVVNNYTSLNNIYSAEFMLDTMSNVELTDLELSRLVSSLDSIIESQSVLDELVRDKESLAHNFDVVATEYLSVKEHYLVIKNLLELHKDEISISAWNNLVQIDIAAVTLDNQFKEFVDYYETKAAVLTAIQLTRTILKLAGGL